MSSILKVKPFFSGEAKGFLGEFISLTHDEAVTAAEFRNLIDYHPEILRFSMDSKNLEWDVQTNNDHSFIWGIFMGLE